MSGSWGGDDGRQPPLPPQIDGEADVPGTMKYYLLSHVAENMPLETPDALAVNNGINDDESSKSVGINVEFIKLGLETSRQLQSILKKIPSRKRKKMTVQILDSANHLGFAPGPSKKSSSRLKGTLSKKKKKKKALGKNKTEPSPDELWEPNDFDSMPNDDGDWNEADFCDNTRGMGFWQSLRREFYNCYGWQVRPKWLASLAYVDKPLLIEKYSSTDLSVSSKPILPRGGGGAFCQISKHINYLIVQIEEIEDMTKYMTQWFPDQVSPGRQYRVLSLTDGFNHVLGFEYESLWHGVKPGVKVALNVKYILSQGVYEGFLKLCPYKTLAHEGGSVEVNATQLADRVKDPDFQTSLKKAYEQMAGTARDK